MNGRDFETIVWQDQQTDLGFLPAGQTETVSFPAALGQSEKLCALLAELRSKYSHVVVDLPSLSEIADAHYAAHLLDGIVVVAEWGRPEQTPLRDQLARVGLDGANVLGVILMRVPADREHQFQSIVNTRSIRS